MSTKLNKDEQNRDDSEKIFRKHVVEEAARRADVDEVTTRRVYDAIIATISDTILAGKRVVLQSFGTFDIIFHKGHPMYFSNQPKSEKSYPILRFFPAEKMKDRIKKEYTGRAGEEKEEKREEGDNS